MKKYFTLYLCISALLFAGDKERISELFTVYFMGETLETEAKILLEEGFRSFVFYTSYNGLFYKNKVKKLLFDMSLYSNALGDDLSLILAVDQEGGKVSRLKGDFFIFPSQEAIAKAGDITWCQTLYYQNALQMREVGFNMNLAPVIDLRILGSYLGTRTFSDKVYEVITYGREAIQSTYAGGIIPVLKHFCGGGSSILDPHTSHPSLLKSLEELYKSDLLPFTELLPKADVVMIGHIYVPALDMHHPLLFSSYALHTFLRKTLNFQGVIMSDSITMQGAHFEKLSLEEACFKAFMAGADNILFGPETLFTSQNSTSHLTSFFKVRDFFLKKWQEGDLPNHRLEEALTHIRELRKKIKNIETREIFNPTLALQLSQQIANSIQEKRILLFHEENYALILPTRYQQDFQKICQKIPSTPLVFYYEQTFPKVPDDINLLIIVSSDGFTNILPAIHCLHKPWIAIDMGGEALQLSDTEKKDPLLRGVIQTFSPDPTSFNKAMEHLFSYGS